MKSAASMLMIHLLTRMKAFLLRIPQYDPFWRTMR